VSALRIGLSTTSIEPGLTGGTLEGIGRYTEALLAGLPAAGCVVQPLSFAPPGVPECLRVGRALPLSYALATIGDLLLPSSARLAVRDLGRDGQPLDLFHATDHRIVRMDCPVVATLHDALPIVHPQWCAPRRRRLQNWLLVRAARKADHVIALSQHGVRELVEGYGLDQRRISVVHHGVDPAWFDVPPAAEVAATLARHGLQAGYFLCVATLTPRKNIEHVLQAYLALPPVLRAARQLLIVGRAGWGSEALVRRIAAARQQGENVLWLDGVTQQQELRQLYAGSGAFVLPSLYERSGLAMVAALAAGVPALCADAGVLPELAQGAALEADPRSVPEWTAAMLAIVRDETLRARCIAAGQCRALQLTWTETVRRTAAVYQSILTP
jgi:glycosyltransferase involved in cell wall biosynthesis